MSFSLEFANHIIALDPARFEDEAKRWAINAIADMIGCTLLGARSDAAEATLLSGIYGAGDCLLLGRKQRLSRLDAAFVNGTAGHALDYDDTSKSLSGHPTVIIVPGLLALAETTGASGKDFVDAYVIGFEAATRFARGVNFQHYEKGWHPTATLGIFGAAVSAGYLLKLNAQQYAHALAMCASLASGIKANFGTSTKPLHAGIAARNGLFAALMAAKGVNASPVAFEHAQGFWEVFNGAGNYDPERSLKDWAQPLDLLAPGISIKKYPCVYSVHAAIDAAIALHTSEVPDSSVVTDILVRMHPRRMLPHVMNPATSALNAKFSLSYAVARGLVNGAVRLDHFEDAALHDPEVTRIMGLIRLQPLDDSASDYGGEVHVTLADGRTVFHTVDAPLGRGPETPLPQDMLATKFLDCAAATLTDAGAAQVFSMLMDLDRLESMSNLTAAIESVTR
ncbi:MmgE/PrpD family protein [Pseudotabrizicola alkalilacus]|uniref:MmgE/PrpD family protein n=1 Tax=Pseudotabrizicola alkalilacus TaxID=2305252 RepID=A0A411YX91_9RHOB|nr:MmgE/PrpD family protein [Pseudotabrizicola alkalilacus]RGP35390.1 MmgE/PrpD family protein [Pseudotabrizicola alkalilacus]